ncbi:MAG: hypothetical protein KDA91_16725 [Planctomycetaceae bacterium]|nr:hypothetical protein [Planctomycetaceae bacterium]
MTNESSDGNTDSVFERQLRDMQPTAVNNNLYEMFYQAGWQAAEAQGRSAQTTTTAVVRSRPFLTQIRLAARTSTVFTTGVLLGLVITGAMHSWKTGSPQNITSIVTSGDAYSGSEPIFSGSADTESPSSNLPAADVTSAVRKPESEQTIAEELAAADMQKGILQSQTGMSSMTDVLSVAARVQWALTASSVTHSGSSADAIQPLVSDNQGIEQTPLRAVPFTQAVAEDWL